MKQLIKNHQKAFYAFMIFNILVPLTNVAFAYSIKGIIDSGMSQNKEALTQAVLVGATVIFIYAALNFISLRLRNKLVRQIMSRYKNKVFQSILDRDYRDFSKEKSGKFISVLTENMKKIEQDYLYQYFNISKNLSLMIFSLLAMFIGNWFLTLLVIIASIIPMMISGFIGQKSASLQNRAMVADQKYLAKVKDILAGFLVIKSFNVKEAIGQDYKNESEKLDEIYFIKGKFDVLSNVISSQVPIHRKFGGVVPEIASRHHIEQVIPVIDQALRDANVTLQDINHIGVTYGPGLVGALLVGVAAAKGLSFATGIPLVPVHHMEGHIFANFLANPELEPPFLSLVVSGGHTMLVHVKGYEDFDVLGQTRDDAAGEAFDKIARVMGFPYPGGPHIDALAAEGNPEAIEFPKALSEPGNFEFSFSGLKSAVLNYLNSKQQKNEPINQADVAASFQKAIVDVLVEKTKDAAHTLGESRITIAGGVSANKGLQKALLAMCVEEGFTYYKPHKILSTDNAAMIGCRAYYMAQAGKFGDLTLNAKPSVEIGYVSWKEE